MSYQPYPGQYQPYPQQNASGGTAIAAGVLASLGAVGQVFGGLVQVVLATTQGNEIDGMYNISWYPAYMLVIGALAVVCGALLAMGAIGLFRRSQMGRMLVLAGCALAILIGIAGIGVAITGGVVVSASGRLGLVGGSFGLVFPIATIVLTVLPATTRWLAQAPVQQLTSPPGGAAPAPPASPVPTAGGPVPNPGPAAPPGAQPWVPGALPPYPAQPASPPNGPAPYSAAPTPFPAAPPVAGAADDSPWRRPEL
ncbi:hypothetical protein KO481_01485 [Nocardia sp. NEAU-G5]|uniref:Uncharacterized protein n=1 Tax=Nocardia albiluteola TaxID=2842303 RepID=A0ABS6AQB3_9NOCA|nr:hypothetical protein [Nocardia albiluteola]MBU3060199.1 hypothetical protein [Nocardia albiluteola]